MILSNISFPFPLALKPNPYENSIYQILFILHYPDSLERKERKGGFEDTKKLIFKSVREVDLLVILWLFSRCGANYLWHQNCFSNYFDVKIWFIWFFFFFNYKELWNRFIKAKFYCSFIHDNLRPRLYLSILGLLIWVGESC